MSREGRYYLDDERVRAQRIVLRVWPSSLNPRKVIVEVFGTYDCPVEVAVLGQSSPFGSIEADELTKLLLTERGAKVFSQGRRIHTEAIELRTLEEILAAEQVRTFDHHFLKGIEGLGARVNESIRQEKLARWKSVIGGEA